MSPPQTVFPHLRLFPVPGKFSELWGGFSSTKGPIVVHPEVCWGQERTARRTWMRRQERREVDRDTKDAGREDRSQRGHTGQGEDTAWVWDKEDNW